MNAHLSRLDRRRPRRRNPRVAAFIGALALIGGACSAGGPSLVATDTTPAATSLPSVEPEPTIEPAPGPSPLAEAPIATPEPAVAPVSPPEVPISRGVSATTIRVGVIKTSSAFADVELGVRARIGRTNSDGGIEGRLVEIVEVIDDGGDPEATLAAAERMVEELDVFAVFLVSTVPEPEVTDYLAEHQMPFFGWGFAPGFCLPNAWGFGFSGCLNGFVRGVNNAEPSTAARDAIVDFFGTIPDVALLTTDDDAGTAASAQAEAVWGDALLAVHQVPSDTDADIDIDALVAEIGNDADVVFLSVGFEQTLRLKAQLIAGFDGLVVDDVTYLPGLLQDFSTAARLEGGYALSQIPPQEEYRAATALVATDVDASGGPLIYSQSVSIGYWSADVFVTLVAAAGEELDTGTFFDAVNISGTTYAPETIGAPCGFDSTDIHTQPSAGAALVEVRDGIYQPVVEFGCGAAGDD